MSGQPLRSLWAVFRWPLLLALLSTAGLLSALIGDGPWDLLSWLLLAPTLVLGLRGLVQAAQGPARNDKAPR